MYRENKPDRITFTKCMKLTIPAADNMWDADLTREMEHVPKGRGKLSERKAPAEARKATANLKQEQPKGSRRKRQQKGGGKTPKGATTRSGVLCSWENKNKGEDQRPVGKDGEGQRT